MQPGSYPNLGSGVTNSRLLFKSPGPIDQNYVGPFEVAIFNQIGFSLFIPTYDSQPVFGMFQTVQNNLYDDKRQALYVLVNAHFPDNSQNVRLYLLISRDNGQTWANPIDVSNTDHNNRGFPSMALDPVTYNLLIGWYDGRNYDDNSLNYYGTVIVAETLDRIVEKIPLSNPLYSIPATPVSSLKVSKTEDKGVQRHIPRSRYLLSIRDHLKTK